MKKTILYILIISLISSCTTLNTGGISETYNVASHNEQIPVYSSFNSKNAITTIPANTNFRVSKTTTTSKKNSRRRIHYDGQDYWVVVLVFKSEKDYATWAHEESMKQIGNVNSTYTPSSTYSPNTHTYQTGPRGGQYYINSNGNKVYKKKN